MYSVCKQSKRELTQNLALQSRKLFLKEQKPCQHCQGLIPRQYLGMNERIFKGQPVGMAVDQIRMSDCTARLPERIKSPNSILAPIANYRIFQSNCFLLRQRKLYSQLVEDFTCSSVLGHKLHKIFGSCK